MTLKEIIDDVIKPEARKEAFKIMDMASTEDLDEFNKYYNNESHNICCLIIDNVKTNLVKQNKLTQTPEDHFGGDLFEE
ncbi:MAG: hypothetical protein DRI95_11515 [Bacteroidetes bacterium]|nr:MAG: hypothetical protein DRI95_11515 [Bacteroidota bacterium]